jgi:hypothetical protein
MPVGTEDGTALPLFLWALVGCARAVPTPPDTAISAPRVNRRRSQSQHHGRAELTVDKALWPYGCVTRIGWTRRAAADWGGMNRVTRRYGAGPNSQTGTRRADRRVPSAG